MPPVTPPQHQTAQTDADGWTRLGGWLFRHRTIIPLPLALIILLWPGPRDITSMLSVSLGVGLVLIGEGLRLWGVRHIGAISRTRSDRLGPLVDSGPFALIRNPLYVGNISLWAGFAASAQLPWLAPIVAGVLGVEYHAIVRWEEGLLTERLGERYREYTTRVPRWLPHLFHSGAGRAPKDPDRSANAPASVFSWRDTLFSERGTLIAIAAGFFLLWIKSHL